jgi:hypothetical protein
MSRRALFSYSPRPGESVVVQVLEASAERAEREPDPSEVEALAVVLAQSRPAADGGVDGAQARRDARAVLAAGYRLERP